MTNILTVDLEEWYVVEALRNQQSTEDWSQFRSTAVANSRRLLALLERRSIRATWFVLGYVAERVPDLIREIADHGHEIGCHSFTHTRVDSLTRESFRKDTERAVRAIAAACGTKPAGYRAPSWSMNANVPWAFETLADLGFVYDSSIFPIKHDLYGMPNGPRKLYRMSLPGGKSLWELPCSTLRLFGQNLPLAGGGYLRHSPYWYTRMMIRALNRQGLPAMVYIHPWELDPDPPRLGGLSLVQRFRMYGSTAILTQKLERLTSEFEFVSAHDYIVSQTRKKIGFEP